jgi:TetR/AcrR family transcriptional repressor of nem operon
MRYDADRKVRTRLRILDMASAILCREGPAAVTLHRVMRELGMSHGGFYGHFESREALLEAAIDSAFDRVTHALEAPQAVPGQGMRDVAARYLGRAHLDAATGCPLPALCGLALDKDLEERRRAMLDRYRAMLAARGADDASGHAVLALMLGGVALARAYGGETGEAVLRDCRHAVKTLENNPAG